MFKRMPVSFKANGKFCVCYGGGKSQTYQKDGIPVTAYDKGKTAFLSTFQSLSKRNSEFDISFNRQQLADFLSVDRSAMSKELGKLRDEGIIEFRKNHFKLKGGRREYE